MNQLVQIDQIVLPDHAPVAAVPESNRTEAHQAEINASALMGWCDSLTPQSKSDVSESLLFAQLAADAVCDKFSEPRRWAEKAIDVLEVLGWRVYQDTSNGSRTLDYAENWTDLAVSAFERGYGGPARLVSRVASAASRLGPQTDGARLWAANGTKGDRGVLLLGLAVADGSGDPIASLMVSSFRADRKPGGILGWNTTGQWASEFLVLRLDTDFYDLFRDQVRGRLGTRVNTEVNEIAL